MSWVHICLAKFLVALVEMAKVTVTGNSPAALRSLRSKHDLERDPHDAVKNGFFAPRVTQLLW